MRFAYVLLSLLLLPSLAIAQPGSVQRAPAPASDKLTDSVSELARAHHGKVAVYAKNLRSGDVVALDADTPVQTASVIKLALLWEAMQQIRAGRAHWSDRLTLNKDNQTDGSGVLGFFDTPLSLTLKDVLSMMVIDLLDNQAQGVIVVRHLRLDGVHAVDGLLEAAEVVVRQTQQR